MGSDKEEEEVAVIKRGGASAMAWFMCSLMVGIGGVAMLVWWRFKFHPTNRQLWMVPVGLILLGTPLITWLSIFLSSTLLCCPFRSNTAARIQACVPDGDHLDATA